MDASQLDICASRLIDAQAKCFISYGVVSIYVGIITEFHNKPPETFPYLTKLSPELVKLEEQRLKYTPTITNITVRIEATEDFVKLYQWASKRIMYEHVATDKFFFTFCIGENEGLRIPKAYINQAEWALPRDSTIENTVAKLSFSHNSEIIYNKEPYNVCG